LQEVPASIFLCKNHKMARSTLDANGVVTLVDETLTGLVTAEVAEVATQYVLDYGQAIFQVPRRGPNGEFCVDENDAGRLLMEYGDGGQRWMAPFERNEPIPPKGLAVQSKIDQFNKDMADFMKKECAHIVLEPVVMHAMDVVQRLLVRSGLDVHRTVLLINHPGKEGDEPVGMQSIHTDLHALRQGFVVFLGLSRYSVLVSPTSHHAIRTLENLQRTNPDLTESDLITMVAAPKLVRLIIEPGQLVLVHGNTVHAGDAGSLGQWAPRLHFYATSSDIVNETMPIEHVHPLLAKLIL